LPEAEGGAAADFLTLATVYDVSDLFGVQGLAVALELQEAPRATPPRGATTAVNRPPPATVCTPIFTLGHVVLPPAEGFSPQACDS